MTATGPAPTTTKTSSRERIRLTTSPGEFALIAKLRERLGIGPHQRPAGAARIVVASGDDAAVTAPAGATATSVDLAIEDVHFRRSTAPPEAIGHKALATALSDLAAMGATPGEAYVQLGLPEGFGEDECLALADGVAAVAREHGVAVLGGDISRAPVLVIAVSVVGHAASAERLVRRDGAREGDAVVVTGELGGAAAGLLLLERPELRDGLAPDVVQGLITRHLRPEPRIEAGLSLAAGGATAMIDISDGVAADAAHVAAASGVGIELEAELLPLASGVPEVAAAAGIDPVRLATRGEDYELLAAVPEDKAAILVTPAGAGLRVTRVGRAVSGADAVLRGRSGAIVDEGFDQLRSDETPPRGPPRPSRGEPS